MNQIPDPTQTEATSQPVEEQVADKSKPADNQPPADQTAASDKPAQSAESDTSNQAGDKATDSQPPTKKKKLGLLANMKGRWQTLNTRSLILIAVFLVVAWWGGVLILLSVNHQYRVERAIAEKENEIIAGEEQLAQQLQIVEQASQVLNQALPDESGLSQFVLAVNQSLSQFPEGRLRFDAQAPIKQEQTNSQYLPLIISGKGAVDQWLELLDKISQSQYLFLAEQVSFAWVEEDESRQTVKVIIRGKLYVNQNF